MFLWQIIDWPNCRFFKACLKQHIVDTFHNRISKLTIDKHSHNSKYLICFDQTKIIGSTLYHSSHIIHEALEIEKHPNNFNREDAYYYSHPSYFTSTYGFYLDLSVFSIYFWILFFTS